MFKVTVSDQSHAKPCLLPRLSASGSSGFCALGCGLDLAEACGEPSEKVFLEQPLTSLRGVYRQPRNDVKGKLQSMGGF